MGVLAATLEAAGMTTYLPQRDGVEAYVLRHADRLGSLLPAALRRVVDRAIFALDVYEIVERCDVLVFNMNGRVPDEGAAVEAGMAMAVGRPVVLYKRDARSAFGSADNAMITQLSRRPPVRDLTRLPEAVRAALGTQLHTDPTLPPDLAAAVAAGARVRRLLDHLPAAAPLDRHAAELIARALAAGAGFSNSESFQ